MPSTEDRDADNTLRRHELLHREDKLKSVVADFNQQITDQEELKKLHRDRLVVRKEQKARLGDEVDSSAPLEIVDIQGEVDGCDADIEQLKSQKETAERDLENIQSMLALATD